jgi:hypothetical protein
MRTVRARGVAVVTSRIGFVSTTAHYAIRMTVVRRMRGALLRLARRRALAMAIGLLLVIPAAWIELARTNVVWWIEGLSFVAGATGLALFWTGLTGPSPDWVE